jgi:hypothetical protein
MKNGVYPVDRFGVVLMLHNTDGSSSSQHPGVFSSGSISLGLIRKHECVCSFHLPISLRMRHGAHIQPNVVIITEPLKLSLSKVRSVISYDAVRVTIPEDDIFQELDSSVSIAFSDRFNLEPLGKFIDHHQNVSHVPSCRFEWSNHIQAPNSKWPSYRHRF